MKLAIILLLAFIAIFIVGCTSKIVYVCYDGTTQIDMKKCPTLSVTQQVAGLAMDNFGRAVAQAKGDTYTRVNIYAKDNYWYSTVIFGNSETGKVNQLLFNISGATAQPQCMTHCDYLNNN